DPDRTPTRSQGHFESGSASASGAAAAPPASASAPVSPSAPSSPSPGSEPASSTMSSPRESAPQVAAEANPPSAASAVRAYRLGCVHPAEAVATQMMPMTEMPAATTAMIGQPVAPGAGAAKGAVMP